MHMIKPGTLGFWLLLGLLISLYSFVTEFYEAIPNIFGRPALAMVIPLIFLGLMLRVFKKTKGGEKERLQARVDQLEAQMKQAGITPEPAPPAQ